MDCKSKSSPPAPAARLLQPSTPLWVRPNALFIAPDPFFTARRVQLVHLAEEPRGDRRVDRRDRWFPASHLFKVRDQSAASCFWQRNGFAAASSVATDKRTTSTKFTVGSSGATPSDNAARRAGENG